MICCYMGCSKMKDEFKFAMMSEFEIKDLNVMQYFLAIEVHQSEVEILICQTRYAEDMLNKFDMADCKPVPTPIAHGFVLCRDDGVEMVDEKSLEKYCWKLDVSNPHKARYFLFSFTCF